jgi:hypothetical protein
VSCLKCGERQEQGKVRLLRSRLACVPQHQERPALVTTILEEEELPVGDPCWLRVSPVLVEELRVAGLDVQDTDLRRLLVIVERVARDLP